MAVLWHEASYTDDVPPLLESISQKTSKIACSALNLFT